MFEAKSVMWAIRSIHAAALGAAVHGPTEQHLGMAGGSWAGTGRG